jgi:nucleolar protein TMA23
MNAHALLSAQGWRGHGHSLHKTSDSIGLSKPLLLNRKDNTKGLGTAQHFNADQWWLNAFDEQLKGLETGKKGQVKQTVTTGKLNTVDIGGLGKYSVYNSFVKGGFLEGTLDLLRKQAEEGGAGGGLTSSDDSKTKNRKNETKEERRQRKEEKRRRKEQRAVKREARHTQRAVRKEARRKMREIRRQARQGKRDAKEEKKKRKEAKPDTSSSEGPSEDAIEVEKRMRRARKEEKRKKRAAES